MIINAGIKRVICEKDYHAGERTKEIFAAAGIQFNLLNNEMTVYNDMSAEENLAKTALAMENKENENQILKQDIPF